MDRVSAQEPLSHPQECLMYTAGLNMVWGASNNLYVLCVTCPIGMTWEGMEDTSNFLGACVCMRSDTWSLSSPGMRNQSTGFVLSLCESSCVLSTIYTEKARRVSSIDVRNLCDQPK